jgi:hypothetical protein
MDLVFRMTVPKKPDSDGIYYCVAYDANDKPMPEEHFRSISATEAYAYASMITGNGRVSSPSNTENCWTWERKTKCSA